MFEIPFVTDRRSGQVRMTISDYIAFLKSLPISAMRY